MRRLLAVLVVVAAAALLRACGGSGSSGTSVRPLVVTPTPPVTAPPLFSAALFQRPSN